jgi:Ca-activated chloride channel family protein
MLDLRRLAAPLLCLLACTATGEPPVEDAVPAADPVDAEREAMTIPPRPPRPAIAGALVASDEPAGQGPRCDDRPAPLAVVPIDPEAPPTPGRMMTLHGGGHSLPLRETRHDVVVVGDTAEISVIQVFHNPLPDPIAALYSYPVPPGVAVDDYWIRLAGREIRGVVKSRSDARVLGEQVRDAADTAALRALRWANQFTQMVADVPPGATVEVELRLVQPLRRADGRYGLTLPMIFGAPDLSGPTVHCPPVDVQVTIEAGAPVADLRSKHHSLTVETARDRVRLEVTRGVARPADQDLEISWRIAGPEPRAQLIARRAEDGGYFTLTVEPPQTHTPDRTPPRELVFVIDTSSSMLPEPLETAVDAIRRVLVTMGPDDTFQVVRLTAGRPPLAPAPLRNTTANVARAVAFLTELALDDGRETLAGVAAALARKADPGRLRVVVFLTDGHIGDDAGLLGELARRRGDARLFALGVGTARNDRVLDGISRVGRGATLRAGPDDRWTIADRLRELIGAPVWTDLEIDWGDLAVVDVVPSELPDLLSGQPVVAHGRFTGAPTREPTLKARRAGVAVEVPVKLDLRDAATHAGLRAQWARQQVAAMLGDPNSEVPDSDTVDAATELAIAHRITTAYTSLVALETRDGQQTPVTPPGAISETVEKIVSVGIGGAGGTGSGYGYGSMTGGRSIRVPTIRQAKADVVGALDKDVVRRIVRSHINEIRKCYNIGLARDRNIKGRVAIEFVIGPNGKLTAAAIKEDTCPDRLVSSCILGAVRGWEFPKPGDGGVVNVVYPFVLEPG